VSERESAERTVYRKVYLSKKVIKAFKIYEVKVRVNAC